MSRWKMAGAVIVLVLLWLLLRNPVPNLHGLTVEQAEEKLHPKFALGKQIGFVEPEKGKGRLLGKIAEQVYLPAEREGEIGVVDYKLYQIDVSRLDEYVSDVPNAIGLIDGSAAERVGELRALAAEIAKMKNAVPEPVVVERVERVERVEPERVERRREKKRRTVTFSELSYGAPKTARNRLGFAVPDRPSTSRVHKSKESFFW